MSDPTPAAPAASPTPAGQDGAPAPAGDPQASAAAPAPQAPDDGAESAPSSDDGGLSREDALAVLSKARKDAAKYRTQVRELEPLAQAQRDAEEANKTEIQRAVDEPLLAIQSRIDETTFEMLIAQYFSAFKQRYVMGWMPGTEEAALKHAASNT